MNKIGFVVLFLFSSASYGAGVHIYHDGKYEKKHIWAITMCGKPVMYVYNHYGRTKIVYIHKMNSKNRAEVNSKIRKIKLVGKKRPTTVLRWPCDKPVVVET